MVKVRLQVYLLVTFTSFLPSRLLLPSWRKNRHCQTGTTSQGSNTGESLSKSKVELLPVILRSQTDCILKSFSLIFIDNCLNEEVCRPLRVYQACVPLADGNLVVTCASSSQQIKTLVSCTSLSKGKRSGPVTALLHQLAGAKGLTYGVPLDLKEEDILDSLQTQVQTIRGSDYGHAWADTI